MVQPERASSVSAVEVEIKISSRLKARPDGIEGLEPVEEIGVLRGRDGAREGLVEVMMRVDQPRQDDVTCEVEDFVGGLREVGGSSDLFDEAVANKKTTIR